MFGLIFTIIITSILPVIVLLYAIKQKRLIPFGLGVAAFVLSQIVLRIPFMQVLEQNSIFYTMLQMTQPVLFSVIIGLSAGVFEELARYFMMRFLMKQRDFKSGILFGFGHGSVEAILFVGINALILLFTQMNQVVESSVFFVSGVERFFAILLHVGLSLIVLRGVVERKFRYVIFAIIAHGMIDALVGILPLYLSPNMSLVVIEVSLAVMAMIVFAYGLSIRKKGVLK